MPSHTPESDRFRSTRAAHASERTEDYVEAIAQLIERTGQARVTDLARMMGVTHVTVSRIVARLAEQKLVRATRHQPITLTTAGERLARDVSARHDVVLRFLLSLGVPAKHAELDAEGIEHHVSPTTIRAMEAWLKRAK
jgi:DtxR family manganese transport transcriptional regulator